MFATVAGISQRAPVRWSENVIGAAICFPYVIALDDEFITVHSMLDQQQKQTLPFKEGHILQDFEGTTLHRNLNEIRLSIRLGCSIDVSKDPFGAGPRANLRSYTVAGNVVSGLQGLQGQRGDRHLGREL